MVLKAFHDATEIISGEKYPTIGMVRPLLKKIEAKENDSATNKK